MTPVEREARRSQLEREVRGGDVTKIAKAFNRFVEGTIWFRKEGRPPKEEKE